MLKSSQRQFYALDMVAKGCFHRHVSNLMLHSIQDAEEELSVTLASTYIVEEDKVRSEPFQSNNMVSTMARNYDEQCRSEFTSMQSRVNHLFVDINISCPYGLPYVSTFHQATFAPVSERAMELFLAAGYRRNGNCLYNMSCHDCSACIPIRLHPSEFSANRNQQRALTKNHDVQKALLPLQPTEEDYALCEKFLQARYPKENNTATGYYHGFFLNTIVNSAQLQYRIGDRLIGTAIIDIGYNWLNAVYFYFDPKESRRSLGTYNILCLIDLCREWEIEFLYLGYYIQSVPAMSYKGNFHPHYLLFGDTWLQKGESRNKKI